MTDHAKQLADYVGAELARQNKVGLEGTFGPTSPMELILWAKCISLMSQLDKSEADNERLKRLYQYAHMCRDGHIQIGHNDSGDDERCPVCRERDRADAAEGENERLTKRFERLGKAEFEREVEQAREGRKV